MIPIVKPPTLTSAQVIHSSNSQGAQAHIPTSESNHAAKLKFQHENGKPVTEAYVNSNGLTPNWFFIGANAKAPVVTETKPISIMNFPEIPAIKVR